MSSWDVTSSPSSKARSNSSDFIDPYLLIPCPPDRDDPDPVLPVGDDGRPVLTAHPAD
jgi:hypothetical protein